MHNYANGSVISRTTAKNPRSCYVTDMAITSDTGQYKLARFDSNELTCAILAVLTVHFRVDAYMANRYVAVSGTYKISYLIQVSAAKQQFYCACMR